MRHGNWIPISKAFSKYLPKDRPYTEIEAAISIQLDYDNKKSVTVSGYAGLWRWSRNKVRNFLNRMGIEIRYPQKTSNKQNQKGQITIQIMDRKRTDKGQIRFIDHNNLPANRNRQRTDNGQKKDRSEDTTIYPNTKPNPKEFSPNSDEFRLAKLLYDLILENDPKAKNPKLPNWAADIDKLHRLDGRSFEEIEAVIRWCQQDDFWHTNILSAGKLRSQFQQLILKMKGNGDGTNRGSNKPGFKDGGAAGQKSKKYSRIGTSLPA